MSRRNSPMIDFLRDVLKQHRVLASQLAVELEVSHPTIGRWLSGEDIPRAPACWRLAEYTGVPLMKVLALAGHIPDAPETPEDQLPEFREYLRLKYPGDLDEDLAAVIGELLNRRRTMRKQGQE